MTECGVCGRDYPSQLEAALCSEIDTTGEEEDRQSATVFRSAD